MAKRPKRTPAGRSRKAKPARKTASGRARARATRKAAAKGAAPASRTKSARRSTVRRPKRSLTEKQHIARKSPRLERVRRTLDDIIPTPPSSLNMNRHGSAVRTGRAEMAEARSDHASMTPAITGGDVDVDLEAAYFSGDEAPGGDNPTPDQEVVDDIGRALGIEYHDNEELRGSDKVAERDKHRWELDPASSEDYRDRKK